VVNTSVAEPFLWGRGFGCDFLTDCTPQLWDYPGYWCDTKGKQGCAADRLSKSTCNFNTISSALPSLYQHFTNSMQGGSQAAAEHCPFYETSLSPSLPTVWCGYPSGDTSDNALGEIFQEDSRCFDLLSVDQNLQQVCFPHRCVNGSVMTLEIQIYGTYYACPPIDSSISDYGRAGNITFSNFTILCPDVEILCEADAPLPAVPAPLAPDFVPEATSGTDPVGDWIRANPAWFAVIGAAFIGILVGLAVWRRWSAKRKAKLAMFSDPFNL